MAESTPLRVNWVPARVVIVHTFLTILTMIKDCIMVKLIMYFIREYDTLSIVLFDLEQPLLFHLLFKNLRSITF